MGTEPFIGEIQMFGGTFAPEGWALCDGQLLSVTQYDALFSLLGTRFGGDGRTTFGLPELRGRVPVGVGQGPGLTARQLGAKFGAEQAVVTADQVPAHTHQWQVTSAGASATSPIGARLASGRVYSSDDPDVSLSAGAVGTSSGSGRSHDNVQPFLVVNFIIALVGIYPSRN